uniref:ARAD1D21208p n=1 Tax=Blastobotrys adeninivorans TaxID=409370 RepID=A0A060TA71_BLAAD
MDVRTLDLDSLYPFYSWKQLNGCHRVDVPRAVSQRGCPASSVQSTGLSKLTMNTATFPLILGGKLGEQLSQTQEKFEGKELRSPSSLLLRNRRVYQ